MPPTTALQTTSHVPMASDPDRRRLLLGAMAFGVTTAAVVLAPPPAAAAASDTDGAMLAFMGGCGGAWL